MFEIKLLKTLIDDRCSSRSSLNDTVSGFNSSTYQQEKAESDRILRKLLLSVVFGRTFV